MIDSILADAKSGMESTIDALKKDLVGFRTGRASVTMLDEVKVEYYGSQMPINQVATLSVPDARLIMIQPWDKAAIEPIEKGIQAANLGLNPQNDGKVIRVPVPPLTEQRRKELVKQARKRCEESKVAIRNVRRDAREMIESLEKDGDASKDEARRGMDDLQSLTDGFSAKIDEMADTKEKEILEF